MYTEEGGYKKTSSSAQNDSEYDHDRIREIAQAPKCLKPHYKKQFQRLLESSTKNIQRRDKELKMLEKEWDQ